MKEYGFNVQSVLCVFQPTIDTGNKCSYPRRQVLVEAGRKSKELWLSKFFSWKNEKNNETKKEAQNKKIPS